MGVIRHISGNLPNIVNRIAQHKKAVGSVLSAGLARSHRANTTASLKVHEMYCTPVLFSGLASLVLSNSEIKIVDHHFQTTLQNIQKLHDKTPRPIVYFLAGSLPGEAILHQRQLGLFSMICHLKGDPLQLHAKYVLTSASQSAQSWFQQIRKLCLKYQLPHPLILLENPPKKESFKKLVKTKITEYWQHTLVSEIESLSSLQHFNPHYHSLLTPHPVWTTAGSSSYECNKSVILGRMISGRYRTESLCRHWSQTNKNGFCLATTCHEVVEDLEHLLILCPALQETRDGIFRMWLNKTSHLPELQTLLRNLIRSNPEEKISFILDPMSRPELICLHQNIGQKLLDLVFYLTRTLVYYIHRQKMMSLGRWNITKMKKNNKKKKRLDRQKPDKLMLKTDISICNPLYQPSNVHVSGLPTSTTQPSRDYPVVASEDHHSTTTRPCQVTTSQPTSTSHDYTLHLSLSDQPAICLPRPVIASFNHQTNHQHAAVHDRRHCGAPGGVVSQQQSDRTKASNVPVSMSSYNPPQSL